MDLLSNPVFIGGVLPMLSFGIMDFLFRMYAGRLPFQNVFLFTALGGLIGMIIFFIGTTYISMVNAAYYLSDTASFVTIFLNQLTLQTIAVGVGLGLIWSICISSMGYAYEKLKANASQVIPIASGSALLGAFLGVLFLEESVSLEKLGLVSVLMVLGIFILSRAEKNISNVQSSLLALFMGGCVPLIGFAILNTLFKVYSSLNGSVLGIIMAITGIVFALILQRIRKQRFIFSPKIMFTGLAWASAVGFLGYGFYPLMGEASQLLPVAGASPLLTILLVSVFLKEPVKWTHIIIGSLCILSGIIFLNVQITF